MKQTCSKCGMTAGHPRYDSASEVLRFSCVCGYTWTRATLDSPKEKHPWLTSFGNPSTGHGHVYPRPDGVKMRCGGPSMCTECAKDLARQQSETVAPR